MMGQPKSGKLSVLLTPDSRRSAWEHELSSCFHCCDFHCYGHTNLCGHPAHTSSLSHADCSCHILSAAAETTPSSSFFSRPTSPPPMASLFCAIISAAWLTGLLFLLLPSSPSRLAKLIDLLLCRPKVKWNLIRRGRSSSGSSCTGCEMKMPAKWRRKTWQRLCAIFQCVPWAESLCSVPCSTGQQRHGNSGESQ